MPFYKELDPAKEDDRWIANGLIRLREALDEAIPEKTLDARFLLATWNIREFGGNKYGGRDRESLYYLAEVLSRFDLIAVEEVRDNLDALDALVHVLGGWWKYLVSDVNQGTKGNDERMAFIYDSRKVVFGGLAGELVPPYGTAAGFWRSPYLAGFRAGWFKFTVCANHLLYGAGNPQDPDRAHEAQMLVDGLKKRMKSKDAWAFNTIIVGDCNVFSTEDDTLKVLEAGDFAIPANLRGKYTNAKLNKPFDQMAFLAPDVERQLPVAKAGVFDYFAYVYRAEDEQAYAAKSQGHDYREWKTYKMSDHLPVWVELGVDTALDYLKRKAGAPIG
jgi:endonuclease/exonuclease/phosphatase family metal-dependent hydrolase